MDYDFQTPQDNGFQPEQENTQHISDVLVTQIILCIGIVVGIFMLNIFRPDISEYLISSFKHHSSMEFSETILQLFQSIYDRV